MSQQETIQILKYLKGQRPNYFKTLSRDDHFNLLKEWSSVLTDWTYDEVFEALNIFLNRSNLTPYPRHVLEIMEIYMDQIQRKTNPWYKHFPKSGDFYYTDKDVEWATFIDWKKLPKEMAKRMYYKSDSNDQEKKSALDEALRLREELFVLKT